MVNIAKNKIVYLAIIATAYLLVLGLLYLLVGQRLFRYSDSLKTELALQSHEIEETKELIKMIPNPEKELSTVEEKIRELRDKAVTKEQVPRIIQQLTRRSSELNINIISIRPLPSAEFSSEQLPQAVNKVYIEVVMSCPYSVLGDYLKALTELPILFTVEKMTVEKKEDEASAAAATKSADVLINLLLSTYMVLEL